MNTNMLPARRTAGAALAALVAYLLPSVAMAQQQPITGQMMDGRTTTMATAPSTPLLTPPQATHPATTATSAASAPMTSAAPSAPVADYAATPAYYATQVGDTTRHLLQMQARGDRAGPPRPMLGAEASASYQRYLKSFEYPIPEFYEATVGKNSRSGR